MSNPDPATPTTTGPARTHAEAGELLRRPFAPGAIGFRAMTKVTLNGVQYGGAQVAAFLGAQSVVQRLNLVVPGRWQQQFTPVPAELTPSAGDELQTEYLLPAEHAVDAVHALQRVRDRVAPMLRIGEIRTIAGDELWLSPAYRQDSVAFHFKQWGNWRPSDPEPLNGHQSRKLRAQDGEPIYVVNIGKKAAGRRLDGRVDDLVEGIFQFGEVLCL
jgi:hypothetical protein